MTARELHTLEYQIEQLIDKHGVAGILQAAANVCHDKATHIRENWTDDDTARQWEKNGNKIARIIWV